MAGAEGAAAAAAASAKRKRDQEEEDEVTPFNSDPSGAVEYKILRSVTSAFKKPEKFRAALEEEARAGWELVEKLDNSRVRLRRSIEWVGMSESVLALWIVLGALAGVAVLMGVVLGILAVVE